VATAAGAEHACNPNRRLDFELFQLRDEISGLDAEIGNYLSSARGRFEQWQAEQERRQQRPDEPADEDS
jgi:hypothetical protein